VTQKKKKKFLGTNNKNGISPNYRLVSGKKKENP